MAAAKLVLTPEADQDIEEAYWWYENQRLGLGEEFFRSLEAALDIIRNLPELRALVDRKYRRAPLRRFPYCVFYKFDGATVTVAYLSHTARDPAKWRTRLP
jgi:plasmid stabilization system protein ParE